MVEVISSTSESCATASSFAFSPPQHQDTTITSTTMSSSFSSSSSSSSLSLLSLEEEIATTRAQLAALRDERQRQSVEQAQHIHKLQYQYESLQHSLSKSSDRLNMFLYTHAMLQAQTTVVQPYILKKQALLCHAFHHNEVLTKQIHLRRVHCDQLVAVLEHSRDQIVDFWQPRIMYLQSHKMAQVQHDIQQLRINMPPQSILRYQQQQQQLSLRQQQQEQNVVLVEEEEEEDDDDISCSSSSTAQSDASHQDVLYQVISMALAVVTEGRLSSVFDKKSTLSSPSSSTLCSKVVPSSASKNSKLDVIWEETTTTPLPLQQRRSLVGFETLI